MVLPPALHAVRISALHALAVGLRSLRRPSAAPSAAWISPGAVRRVGPSFPKMWTHARLAGRRYARNVDPRWRTMPRCARYAGRPSRMCVKRAGPSYLPVRPVALSVGHKAVPTFSPEVRRDWAGGPRPSVHRSSHPLHIHNGTKQSSGLFGGSGEPQDRLLCPPCRALGHPCQRDSQDPG